MCVVLSLLDIPPVSSSLSNSIINDCLIALSKCVIHNTWVQASKASIRIDSWAVAAVETADGLE